MQTEADALTPERKLRGGVKRLKQVADANGEIGSPWRVTGLLEGMERRNKISPQMRQAGEMFREMFYTANLDPIRAPDMGRIPGGSSHNDSGKAERAKRGVGDALRVLGGPGASCAWFVVGCDMSLRQWSERRDWGGKPLSKDEASGALVCALGVLSAHFGLE